MSFGFTTNIKRLLVILALSGLMPFFQNCTAGSGQSVKFEGDPHFSSGNGTPYEGKPDPGEYYRVVPGFTCGTNNKPALAGKLTVTTRDIHSQQTNPDCSQTERTLQFSDVEASALNRNNLGFKDGIYEKAKSAPAPTAPAPETWCRSVATGVKSFEVMIGTNLQASLKIEDGGSADFTPVRSQSGASVSYQTGGINIALNLSIQSTGPGEVRGYLTSAAASGELSCRTVLSPPAPTGGYFVLSATPTNANFGGLAGANAYCLNDLRNNDWKGKVNATLDAAHVYAFLCDRNNCQNLDPNKGYTMARSGDTSIGGRRFQTDGNGRGPGTMFVWDTADTFGPSGAPGDLRYWTNRDGNPNDGTIWDNAPAGEDCNNWTTGSNIITGAVGIPTAWNNARWGNGGNICSDLNRVICVVRGD